MLRKIVGVSFVVVSLVVSGLLGPERLGAQEQKKRSGTLIGELKSQKPTPNGKNTIFEVLAPGEEKARSYRVLFDPKVKGPIPAVLEAVRAAKVGDRVQLEWVDTGEGLAVKSFEVLKKADKKKG